MVDQEEINTGEHEIKTGNGNYIIKVPTGRFAARHFSLMRRAAPKNRDEDGNVVVCDADEDNYQKCFELWSAHVLPGAVVKYPPNIKDYDNMPGEDMYAIWNAMFDLAKVGLDDGSLFLITR